jgi:hypothetical protein
MSARLRDLLDDMATDARGYGDPDRAVASARRRVTARRVAVPLVAAAAVAILAAVLSSPAVRDGADRGPEIGTTPDAHPEYPDRVTVPNNAERLPDSPLSKPAAFVYAPCPRDCDPYLVLPDATQYRLPRPDIGPPDHGYSLSPDGRWLGWPTAAGFQLRDLVGGQAISISDSGPGVTEAWVWAPDSRTVLLARHHDGAVVHYLLWSLHGGARMRLAPPPATVVAIRNNGDLIGWVAGGEPDQLPVLGIIPHGQSTVVERLAVRLPPNAGGDLFRAGERFMMDALYLSPADGSGVLVVNAAQPRYDTYWPAGVLGLELAGGGYVSGRIDMPLSTGAGPGDWHVWEVANNLAGGVVLLHWQQGRTEIVVLNEVNGDRVVATVLPGDSQVRVRGDGRY